MGPTCRLEHSSLPVAVWGATLTEGLITIWFFVFLLISEQNRKKWWCIFTQSCHDRKTPVLLNRIAHAWMIRVQDRNSVNPVVDKSEVMNNIKDGRWGEDPGRTGWQLIGLTETSSVGSNPASAPCFILLEYCFVNLQTVAAGRVRAGWCSSRCWRKLKHTSHASNVTPNECFNW